MPQFDSPGAGFARGLGRFPQFASVRNERERLELEKGLQEADRITKLVSADRKKSLEMFTKFAEIAKTMAELDPDNPDIEQIERSAMAALMSHAQTLQSMQESGTSPESQQFTSQFETPQNFVESNMELFQASVSGGAAAAGADRVERLSPEETTSAGFPGGAVVQREADGKLVLTFDPTDNPSTKKEQFEFLVSSGQMTTEQAALVVGGGVAVGFDPITRSFGLFNKGTGEPIGGEETAPSERPETPSMFPEGIVTPEALGTAGILRNVSNVLKDTVGLGLAFPEAQEATNALESLNLYTISTLQAEIPGRPSQFLLERIEKLAVLPNSFFQGEERSKSRLKQTKRLINGEIARIENEVLTQKIKPEIRSETNINLTQLKRLDQAYADLISGFDAPTAGDVPEGVSADDAAIWHLLSDEAKKLILKQVQASGSAG